MDTYEKKYKEALEKAKDALNDGTISSNTIAYLQDIFPELKESEDERIRKSVLAGLIDCRDDPDMGWSDFGGIPIDDCIAWLEKQKEQKEDVTRYKIAEYLKKLILDQSQRGAHILDYEGRIEEEVDFIISIAKKELKKIPTALEVCEIQHIEHGKYYYCIKDYFCGGKKQASKGDVVKALRGMSMMALGVKANEYFLPVNSIKCNPAWSEEDEKMFDDVINNLHNYIFKSDNTYSYIDCDKHITWLKSLKQRIGGGL